MLVLKIFLLLMKFLATSAYFNIYRYTFFSLQWHTHLKIFYTHKKYQLDLENANSYMNL